MERNHVTMAIVYPREVKFYFPGTSKPSITLTINIRFRSRLPRYLGSDGVALGKTVYIRAYPDMASNDLIAHELLHVWEHLANHKSILGDLWDYFKVWVQSGFKYSQHTEERFAYEEAIRVVKGTSPFVFCNAITSRYLTGFSTIQ